MGKAADIYMSDQNDIWAFQNQMWTRLNRERLLHEKPAELDAPVYEVIEREMIHDTYGRGTPLEEFIDGLRKKAAKARGGPVFVSYDSEGDYEGGSYTFFEIGFERPPTAKEVKDRKARNAEIREVQAEAAAKAAERERAEFKRLSAKFRDSDTQAKPGDAQQGSASGE